MLEPILEKSAVTQEGPPLYPQLFFFGKILIAFKPINRDPFPVRSILVQPKFSDTHPPRLNAARFHVADDMIIFREIVAAHKDRRVSSLNASIWVFTPFSVSVPATCETASSSARRLKITYRAKEFPRNWRPTRLSSSSSQTTRRSPLSIRNRFPLRTNGIDPINVQNPARNPSRKTALTFPT